jgi:N-methylhydantoinase B
MTDQLELELFRATVISLLDEIELNLSRTAFSPLIAEYKDYCIGFLSPDFRLVAQSRGGLPMFIADLGPAVKDAVEQISELLPGDVFVTNYAAVQGQHLNNVIMAAPLFQDDELLGYVAIRAHWTDVGGMAPMSISWNATEIYQEGFQMRGLRVARAGKIQTEVVATLLANSRFKVYLDGDIRAQFGACLLAQRRWDERVASRWSVSEIAELWDAQLTLSAEVARRAIRALPNGVASVSCLQDDSGRPGTPPLRLALTMTIQDDTITLDLSDMPPEVAAPINSGRTGGGLSMCRLAFKAMIAPDYPVDEGLFEPLLVEIPDGTLLSAREGAPMGHWNSSLALVGDLVAKAMAELAPELAPASHHGSVNIHGFSGQKEDGSWWTTSDTLGGGWGGSANADGFSNLKTNHHGDNRETSVEVREARFPVRVLSWRLVPDSAGDGLHRGGYATEKVLEVDVDAFVTTSMDRTLERPWGVNGGEPGTSGGIELELPDGELRPAAKVTRLPVPAGTRMRVRSAGGGGWGEPAQHSTALREADRVAGLDTTEKVSGE